MRRVKREEGMSMFAIGGLMTFENGSPLTLLSPEAVP